MNGLKALKGTAVALSLVALAGCGQAYNPGPEEHIAGPSDKGDVFGSNPDTAPYQTVSYEVLRTTLLTTILTRNDSTVIGDQTNFAGTPCAGLPANPGCPLTAPVTYLDNNKGSMGVAVYTASSESSFPASLMTSGGFKAWILAASSACGKATTDNVRRGELFPNGVSDYNHFYQATVGRSPTAEEVAELDMLQASFSDDPHKAAAVCTTVLLTLENLAQN
jgi:predicted small lipoprotein YifL